MSTALGLECPQCPVFRHQIPWEGPLRGRPRVKVSLQEASRPDPPAVQCAEGRAKVSALARGSEGPSVLARGAFEGRGGL